MSFFHYIGNGYPEEGSAPSYLGVAHFSPSPITLFREGSSLTSLGKLLNPKFFPPRSSREYYSKASLSEGKQIGYNTCAQKRSEKIAHKGSCYEAI